MLRIFVCYARVNKSYCAELVQYLDGHDVWFDDRLYAGGNWWHQILQRLDWCQVFIFVISPDSIKSQYCLKELEVAIKLGRPIIPILITQGTRIPKSIAHLHYVDATRGHTGVAVHALHRAMRQTEQELRLRSTGLSVSQIDRRDYRAPISDMSRLMDNVIVALKSGNYDQAVFLLRTAKNRGIKLEYIDLDQLLEQAEKMLAKTMDKAGVALEYRHIYELIKFEDTRLIGIQSFRRFQQMNPKYDPKDLNAVCDYYNPQDHGSSLTQGSGGGSIAGTASPLKLPPSRPFPLPMFEWRPVTGGIVRNDDLSTQARAIEVAPFRMSKFMITNEQYEVFIRDPRGYHNAQWWKFSRAAYEWHQSHPEPLTSKFQGKTHPREHVNWYEAVAFCYWLSTRVGYKITLQSVAQWQRAVQGDTDRIFAWGNTLDITKCNTQESKLRMTTPVDHYEQSTGQFGIYDLHGNVWTWCRNRSDEIAGNDYKRATVGGSYVGSISRAQVSTQYYLGPQSRFASIGFRIVTAGN